jgi:hypothetical protein
MAIFRALLKRVDVDVKGVCVLCDYCGDKAPYCTLHEMPILYSRLSPAKRSDRWELSFGPALIGSPFSLIAFFSPSWDSNLLGAIVHYSAGEMVDWNRLRMYATALADGHALSTMCCMDFTQFRIRIHALTLC